MLEKVGKGFGPVILSLALFVTGCATAPARRPGAPAGQIYLKDFCDRRAIPWKWDSLSQTVILRTADSEARVLIGSNIFLLGTTPVSLSAPVALRRSSVIVPSDFPQKLIGVQRREAAREPSGAAWIREIVLDAGHGGKDPGALGLNGTREKNIVLDITQRLKKILEKRGIKVVMTRASDEFISLQERTEIASRSKADLFVSVHANSSPVRSVCGIEVFVLKDLDSLEKNEAQRRANHELMFKNLAMKQNPSRVEEIVADMLYTYKQGISGSLASSVAAKTAKHAKTPNRGFKRARFFVLRNTLIPAVLAEVGFLSNPKEEKLLNTGSYRQKLAEGLAKGILEYGGRYQ